MTAYSNYTDRQLFLTIAEGNEQAFRCFFYRYNTKVFYFALHIVKSESIAEEITQDVFLRLWIGHSMLASVMNPGNYLFVMAKNRSLDQIGKQARQKKSYQAMFAQLSDVSNSTEEEIIFRESMELINCAVQRLPEQQRVVYQLSKEQGMSREEIAMHLKVSPHTVKNHLRVAIKFIQQYLRLHGIMALFQFCFSLAYKYL